MKKLFLFVLMTVSVATFSQLQSYKGYVLSMTGDTEQVEIKVNPKKTLEQFQKVTYKSANGQQKVMKAGKVKGYGYEGKHYILGQNEGENVFYKMLSNGDLSLFELEYEVLLMNEIHTKNERFFRKKGTDDFVHLKHNRMKKQLKEQMAAHTELVKEIDSKDEITDDAVIQVFEQYNTWAKTNKI
jgi:hypothetical protein